MEKLAAAEVAPRRTAKVFANRMVAGLVDRQRLT
jgi:hypothetical protein